MQPAGCEQVVEYLNRDRALSDCRRHAFRGAAPDIAGRENPRHARLEQKWTAGERPRVAVAKICSGEDETLVIPLDLRWQPFRVRAPSDHEEERVGVNGFLASPEAIRVVMGEEYYFRARETTIQVRREPSRPFELRWIVVTGRKDGKEVKLAISTGNAYQLSQVWSALAGSGAVPAGPPPPGRDGTGRWAPGLDY